ncbi:hypothetical protein BA6E_121269 [Bacteroidales bacterium 6E]|nr:hypothetical protein BA6E_121269 [Bacteroidales bacterium 6E]
MVKDWRNNGKTQNGYRSRSHPYWYFVWSCQFIVYSNGRNNLNVNLKIQND